MKLVTSFVSVALLGLVLGLVQDLNAQTVWTGNTSSDWFTASNWSPQVVPTSANTVELTSNDYTDIASGSAQTGALHVGYDGDGAASLSISGPGSLSSTIAILGQNNSTTSGYVMMSNSSWTLSSELFVGDYGAGSLEMDSGSTITAGTYIRAGWNTGSMGVLVIDGSTLSAGTAMQIGHFGTGILGLTNGAILSTPLLSIGSGNGGVGMVNLGDVAGLSGVGAINVNGGGFLWGNGFISGGPVTVGSGGHLVLDQDNVLEFAAGSNVTLATGSQLNFTLNENAASYLTIVGSDFTAGAVTVNITEDGGFGTGGVTYNLLDFSAANPNSVSLANFSLGWSVTGYELAVNGNVLQLVAVPEPATCGVLAGAVVLGLAIVRRRAKERGGRVG